MGRIRKLFSDLPLTALAIILTVAAGIVTVSVFDIGKSIAQDTITPRVPPSHDKAHVDTIYIDGVNVSGPVAFGRDINGNFQTKETVIGEMTLTGMQVTVIREIVTALIADAEQSPPQ